ncbi:SDR family oxidoreductase [Shinella zoogloeoides]|uniref:SDR family oxidoreductase n=1 Tax=Shinella zoogloeoides TaxID=352475 RepID=UPI000E64B48A|nr:SDR family oxidoreductase [Shinella zoogloeoides]
MSDGARLDGRIAVVTGGTQGLGATIARLFAERGAAGLVICGRNAAKGEAKAREISEMTGVKTVYVQADLEKVDDARAVIAAADKAFGRIDALVNAAALTDRGTILDTSPELFDRMFAVNVRAPFFLMQEAIKVMRREKIEGTIVNIGSMSAKAGQPFISTYCASKGALETLTKNTAYAVLRNRIRVNGLNIGWMASEGEDRIQREYHGAAEDWLAKAAAAQPFGRLVDPAEVARACAYLSSAESGLMTGSVICFDQSIWGAYDGSPHPEAPL